MLIDRHMPRFDVTQSRHVLAHAHVEETHDAVGTARLNDAILRLGFHLSRMPSRILAHAQGREPLSLPRDPTLKETAWRSDWLVLDERPADELVNGAIYEVRRFAPPKMRRVAATDFPTFEAPGHVKIAVGISLRPYGPERTLISMEARARATDDATRRVLRTGWKLGQPVVRYGMDRILDSIRRKAEHLPPPPPPGEPTTLPTDNPRQRR